MIHERVAFKTMDGVTIVGDWALPEGTKRAVLLLHMMPATRVSWQPLSQALNAAGFATLAIDLRGHGESVTLRQAQGDKKLDYQNFSDAEHQASRLDVDSAMNFLKQKGFDENAIALVGASIGANLSLDALYRYKGATRAVLLSPGLDYRGVKTEPIMKGLNANQKVWIVAAEGDAYSAESSLKLQQLQKETARPSRSEAKPIMRPKGATLTVTIFGGAEHGTNLFKSEPTLVPDIVKFLLSS